MTPATRSLLRAAADGDASLVRALLAQGTDVNGRTAAGQTPLMLAAAFGHENVVALLLGAGADKELQDELGLSAKDWSAKSPDVSILINDSVAAHKPEDPETTEVPELPPVPENAASPVASEIPATPGIKETQTVEPTQSVVFPKPRTTGVRQDASRPPGLGGLAGAILRDRAVKPTEQDEIISQHLVPEPPRDEKVNQVSAVSLPPFSSTPSETDNTDAPYQVEEILTAKPETISKAPVVENLRASSSDENTLAGKRAQREPEVVDTVSAGRTLIPRQTVIHEKSSVSPARVSKVQVPVPSFGITDTGGSRPLKWVVVIIFLAAGAAGGYFLSDYILKRNAAPTTASPNQPATQPSPAIEKPGPTVGGNLEGAESFLPDADYPPGVDNLSGHVTVAIQVDQHGTVISTKALDGDERLQRQAIAAASRAAFSPEKIKGKGRVVSGTVTYNFIAPQGSLQSTASSSPSNASGSQSTPAPSPAGTGELYPTVSGPLAGSELSLPQPDYPDRLKSKGIAGTVAIVVRVNRSGQVVSWRTENGDSRLRVYALSAAKKSTFSPEKLSGTGDVVGTLTYTFK